jgi:methyltransferase
MAITTAYFALLALVGLERLVELVISRRNQRRLEQQGARQVPEPHFRWLVLLHGGVLAAAAAEVALLHRPLIPTLAVAMGVLFVLSNALRWWVIGTLAGHWTVKVKASSNFRVEASGPYKWVRHPNYVGVVMEVFSLPMIHTAWITAIAGTLGYLEILRRRIRLEDEVLLANPSYRTAMGAKPRFFPKLF